MKPMKCPECGHDMTPEYADDQQADENGEGAPMEIGEGMDPSADEIAKAVVAQMKQNNIKGPKGS